MIISLLVAQEPQEPEKKIKKVQKGQSVKIIVPDTTVVERKADTLMVEQMKILKELDKRIEEQKKVEK
jgi:spore coat polysaccharide biosynthesis predicted glycosyltransferase SpsG